MHEELGRAFRVADMLVSSHSTLRDRFARRALALDLLILAASVWITAMAFVDPKIGKFIAIPGLSPTLTIGLIGISAFLLSLFQLRTDWKQRADRHEQAARSYAASKLEIGAVMNAKAPTANQMESALRRYQALGGTCISIPEAQFNILKRKHLLKVAISKEISRRPGASIWMIRLKLWARDSIELHRGKSQNDPS